MNPKNTPFHAPAVLPPVARDTTALLAHPDVVRHLRATIRRHGVAWQDLADAVADAQVAALEAARAGRMPKDLAEWKALSSTIAVRRVIDRRRDVDARDRCGAGPCEDADACSAPTMHWEARDPVDQKRYLAVLDDLVESGAMPAGIAEILMAEAHGIPHAQIAAELGVSETTVNNRLSRARAMFIAKLAALGMLVLAVVLAFAMAGSKDVVTQPAPRRLPEIAPSAGPHAPRPCEPGWDAGACPPPNSSAPVRENRAFSD